MAREKITSVVIGYGQETIPEVFRLSPSVGCRDVKEGQKMFDGTDAPKSGIEMYEKTLRTRCIEALPKVAAVAVITSPYWARGVASLIHGLYDWRPDDFLHQHLTMHSYGHSDVSGISLDGHSTGTMDMGDGKIHLIASQVGSTNIHLTDVQTNPIHVTGDLTGGTGDVAVTGHVTGTSVEITDYGAQGQLKTEGNIDLDLKDVNANIKNIDGKIEMNIPKIDINGDGKMEGVKLNVEGGQLQYRGDLHGSLSGTVKTDTETDFTEQFKQACLVIGGLATGYFLSSYIPGTKSRADRLKMREELAHYRESMDREQKMEQLTPVGENYLDRAEGENVELEKLPDWVTKIVGTKGTSKKAARKIIGEAYDRRETETRDYEMLVGKLKKLNPVTAASAPKREHWYSDMFKGKPKAATPAPAKPIVHPPAPKKAAAPAAPATPAAKPKAAAATPPKITKIAPAKPTAPPAGPPKTTPEPAKPMTWEDVSPK